MLNGMRSRIAILSILLNMESLRKVRRSEATFIVEIPIHGVARRAKRSAGPPRSERARTRQKDSSAVNTLHYLITEGLATHDKRLRKLNGEIARKRGHFRE